MIFPRGIFINRQKKKCQWRKENCLTKGSYFKEKSQSDLFSQTKIISQRRSVLDETENNTHFPETKVSLFFLRPSFCISVNNRRRFTSWGCSGSLVSFYSVSVLNWLLERERITAVPFQAFCTNYKFS